MSWQFGCAALASVAIVIAATPAPAKEYTIRGQNRATYSANCKSNPNCVNWGGGVFTTGETKVICTKTKCTMYEDDAPERQAPSGTPVEDAPDQMR